MGCKYCLVLNQIGQAINWELDRAYMHDSIYQPLIRLYEEKMIILGGFSFQAAEGDSSNMKLCAYITLGDQIVIEQAF